MSHSPGISRRALLRALALGVPGALLPGRARASLLPDSSGEDTRRALWAALTELVPERNSARQIGRAYLRAYADDTDADGLARLLVGGAGGTGEDLPGRLRRRIRRDFREADVVWVRGWLLSRTEARLCAFALLA